MITPDSQFMAQALQLARRGIYTTDPNPAVGCLLVKDQHVLAEGWTQRAGQAHAEIHALGKAEQTFGATAYVTLEPCSHHGRTGPCCDALIAAGIRRVVVAMQDPNPLVAGNGLQRLHNAGIEVVTGVLADEAAQLNQGFFKRMRQGLPWVRSKLAMSLDGRTALASGLSQWITSSQAREDVHRWRAASSAILTGIGTVIADNPGLDARVSFDHEPAVKVILDSQLRLPVTAKLLQTSGQTWIFTEHGVSEHKQHMWRNLGCRVFTVERQGQGLNLHDVFCELGRQQINSVWIEAGATLNGALLETDCVDEWLFYMAPCVLGSQARGLFDIQELHNLVNKPQFKFKEIRHVGPDLRLTMTQT